MKSQKEKHYQVMSCLVVPGEKQAGIELGLNPAETVSLELTNEVQSKKTCAKKHWFQEMLGLREFLVRKNFVSKIILCAKKFCVKKKSWSEKVLGPKTFCVQTNFVSKIICC